MRALNWDGARLHLDPAYPRPAARGESALVRVRLAGICSTDLQILKGYMGFRGVPGHEFIGEVEDGPPRLLGRRVVGEINFACGECALCARGWRPHCERRRVMGIVGADGAFAEYVEVPAANLHVVPETVADEEAVFTEPLAAAFEILEQLGEVAGEEAVVFGDGKLGLLCAQVLRLAGARVSVVGRHPRKLGVASRMGLRAVSLSEWRREPRAADLAVEATGSAGGLPLALDCVRPRGKLVLKSTLADEHTLSLARLVINEITVVGSRCGPFAPALRALAEGNVAVRPLVESVYPLEQGIAALEHAGRPGTLKVLLRM